MFNKDDNPRVVNAVLQVQVLRVGSGYMARGKMAGVEFHGNRQPQRPAALLDLFMQLTQGVNPEATLAVDMAANGEDWREVSGEGAPAFPELTTGQDPRTAKREDDN